MPIYEYKCDCGQEFETFEIMRKRHKKAVCPRCGNEGVRIFSIPNLKTDTNFIMTGQYDSRLGCKIEGRKHWNKAIAEKGLMEIDINELRNTTPTTTEERIRKAGKGIETITMDDVMR